MQLYTNKYTKMWYVNCECRCRKMQIECSLTLCVGQTNIMTPWAPMTPWAKKYVHVFICDVFWGKLLNKHLLILCFLIILSHRDCNKHEIVQQWSLTKNILPVDIMKHKQNLTILCLISLITSILIFLHTQEFERLIWSIFSNNLEWISYKQQELAKQEYIKCSTKSKVFVKLQDLNDFDRCNS